MKTLGLWVVMFVLSGVSPVLNAQSQKTNESPNIKTNKAAVQDWLAKVQRSQDSGIVLDRFLSESDGRDQICGFMRTYRVKREGRGSDITRPAGYTTCVPLARFTTKSAVITVTDGDE